MTLSRTYLESLTTADLISLADDYGIDIPEGLSRRFIIGELLEVIDEPPKASGQGDMNINNSIQITTTLPKTYNETQISAILRNPAWIFVYWDINDADMRALQHPKQFSTFILRVLYFAEPEDEKPAEVYEIPVQNSDRERYIFLSQSFKIVRVDLIIEFKNKEPLVLAHSQKIVIPKSEIQISSPVLNDTIAPILEISGLPELYRAQYTNHRQSFS